MQVGAGWGRVMGRAAQKGRQRKAVNQGRVEGQGGRRGRTGQKDRRERAGGRARQDSRAGAPLRARETRAEWNGDKSGRGNAMDHCRVHARPVWLA